MLSFLRPGSWFPRFALPLAVTVGSASLAHTATADETRVASADWTFGAPGVSTSSARDDAAPSAPEPASPRERPHRRFGLGTMFGGGLPGYTISAAEADVTAQGYLVAVSLPTLEAQIFVPHGYSVDLSSSVTGTAFWGAFRTAYFTQDAFFNFNFGKHIARAILGPGIGFTVAAGGGKAVGSVRLPAEVGIEALTNDEQFGFKLVARPWLELPFGHGAAGPGGGAVALIGVSGYFVK